MLGGGEGGGYEPPQCASGGSRSSQPRAQFWHGSYHSYWIKDLPRHGRPYRLHASVTHTMFSTTPSMGVPPLPCSIPLCRCSKLLPDALCQSHLHPHPRRWPVGGHPGACSHAVIPPLPFACTLQTLDLPLPDGLGLPLPFLQEHAVGVLAPDALEDAGLGEAQLA